MFSERPSTPGRSAQVVRATTSICAPACEAAYSSSTSRGSTRWFDLEPDARVLALGGRRGDRADLLHEPAAQRERRDEQLAEARRLPEAGDVVEEVGDVRGDLLVRGEDADVLVQARGRGVVVPGADVRVAAQHVALAPDDERHLRVDLEVGEAVDDVDAGLLQRARPLDVPALVEARLELDEADRLLAVLRALDERADEGAVVARPVHGGLHRDHVRVLHRGLREDLEAAAERLVRLVHGDVAAPDLVEDARHARSARRRAAGGRRAPTARTSGRGGRGRRAPSRSARSSGLSMR